MKEDLRPVYLLRLTGWLLLLLVVDGCQWNLDTQPFPKCESPTAQVGHSANLLDVTFVLTETTGTTNSVKWEFGDGAVTNTTSFSTSHNYEAPGKYTIRATLTNLCGDTYTTPAKDITISNVVPPTVTIQEPVGVTSSGVTLPMTVTDNGRGVISRYGLCYSSTNKIPTVDSISVPVSGTVSVSANPTVGAVNSLSASALQPNTVYYVRAFAYNESGTIPAYSSEVKSFTTAIQIPVVTTVGTSSVDKSTALVQFRLEVAGVPAATRYGICYSDSDIEPKVGNPLTLIADVPNPMVGMNVPVSLTNLTASTLYYYRSFAVYGTGVAYGAEIYPFKTSGVDLVSGLVVDIRFDNNNANDISGRNNHAVLKNGATFTTNRKGTPQTALNLDGIDDYIEIADDSSLRPKSISISCWIKPSSNALQSKMQVFIKNRFADGEHEQYSAITKKIGVGSGATKASTGFDIKKESECKQSNGWEHIEVLDLVEVNTWQHMVYVYEGSTLKIYRNGKPIYTKPTKSSQSFMDDCPGGTLKFGAQSVEFPNYFQGAMDDIRVYNRALTDEQVTELFFQ